MKYVYFWLPTWSQPKTVHGEHGLCPFLWKCDNEMAFTFHHNCYHRLTNLFWLPFMHSCLKKEASQAWTYFQSLVHTHTHTHIGIHWLKIFRYTWRVTAGILYFPLYLLGTRTFSNPGLVSLPLPVRCVIEVVVVSTSIISFHTSTPLFPYPGLMPRTMRMTHHMETCHIHKHAPF